MLGQVLRNIIGDWESAKKPVSEKKTSQALPRLTIGVALVADY
jgi:hypothetical protein